MSRRRPPQVKVAVLARVQDPLWEKGLAYWLLGAGLVSVLALTRI